MKLVVRLLLSSLLLVVMSSATQADEQVVSLLSWADYFDPTVLEDFTKETGIKVVYDTYDSDAALTARLAHGRSGYDVIVASVPVLQRQIAGGLLQKLDKSRLPNIKNLWPEIMAQLARVDPHNQYAVNYLWSAASIAFDTDKARERLVDASLDSWDVIFRPDNLRKFGDCGVDVIDNPQPIFAIALLYLKLDPNSKRIFDLRRAAELLSTLRRNVDDFDSSGYINALANGDICLAVGWSSDAMLARNRAHESDSGTEVGDVIPKEGSVLALDNLAIPKDAPHAAAAHAFIDFMLRPNIAARNTNAVGLASGVLAAKPLVNPAISGNKAIYPDDDTVQRLFAVTNYDPATERFVAREWALIKATK